MKLEALLRGTKRAVMNIGMASLLAIAPACGGKDDDNGAYNPSRAGSGGVSAEAQQCCSCMSNYDCMQASYSQCINTAAAGGRTPADGDCINQYCYTACVVPDLPSSGGGSSESWRSCCSCMTANQCTDASLNACLNSGEADARTSCVDQYCSSQCSGADSDPYCIPCGEIIDDTAYPDDEDCPTGMHCAYTLERGLVCMPNGATQYQCI